MTMLMMADEPRMVGGPPSLPAFNSEAERYAWIAREYKRRLRPGAKKTRLARDIAAAAFHISIAELCGASREAPISEARHRIACVIRALTNASTTKIGEQIGRTRNSVSHALRRFGEEVACMLGPKGDA